MNLPVDVLPKVAVDAAKEKRRVTNEAVNDILRYSLLKNCGRIIAIKYIGIPPWNIRHFERKQLCTKTKLS